MDLFLQFGHGMMNMSKNLMSSWNGGTIILSPRDLTLDQMLRFQSSVDKLNGKVVVDPQFYIPRSNHNKLVSHSFWPSSYQTSLFNSSEIKRMLSLLKDDYNDPLNSDFFILPGLITSEVNEDWYNYNRVLIEQARTLISDKPIYLTICLSKEAMNREDDIHQVIEYTDALGADGYYVVAEPPASEYLVTDPNWLVNLLDLTAGLKHQDKKVVVGYANHQMLLLALSKIDAIASGNWLNVRSFNTGKFNNPEDSKSRRSKWYYCPQALSEYQVVFLDLANRVGVLPLLKTDPSFGSTYTDLLFDSGAQPTTVNYKEGDSFQHYLHCLRHQALQSVKETYSLTKEGLKMQLETSRMLTGQLSQNGVIGRARDFGNIVDYNLSAISVFDNLRGMIQSNMW